MKTRLFVLLDFSVCSKAGLFMAKKWSEYGKFIFNELVYEGYIPMVILPS